MDEQRSKASSGKTSRENGTTGGQRPGAGQGEGARSVKISSADVKWKRVEDPSETAKTVGDPPEGGHR